MSHLREQISALIDGELTGAELDRAHAHLAACAMCRAEAAGLRQLKRELRALAPGTGRPETEEDLTRRLLAMAGPGGPVPSRRFRRDQLKGNRPERHGGRQGNGRTGPAGRGGTRPGGYPRTDMQRYPGHPPRGLRRRGRYVLLGAVSLVVVGVGAAAFNMGGGSAQPGPMITPQIELQMFGLEHAINSGDVPFPDPTQASKARP